jgi:isopentenyl-diphosphate delta-isomerase
VSVRGRVELVDEGGTPIGACSVVEAHSPPGRLHRAFSVLLFDADGRMLMQRRALDKSRFPGRWTNTCCSHPAPGDDLVTSARERVADELGLQVGELREVGSFVYRAADEESDAVEHEYDHVLVGECAPDAQPTLDPSEIHSVRWMSRDEVLAGMREAPDRYSPWLPGVLRLSIE